MRRVLNTVLTEPLRAWLKWAADPGHRLVVEQLGRDIVIYNSNAPAGGGLTPSEDVEITSLLAAHAADPFTTCPKDQP